MRLILDAALFGAVFAISIWLFQSVFYAALAGLIIAGAGDALVWTEPKKR